MVHYCFRSFEMLDVDRGRRFYRSFNVYGYNSYTAVSNYFIELMHFLVSHHNLKRSEDSLLCVYIYFVYLILQKVSIIKIP